MSAVHALEGLAARGVEVLLLTDPFDELWIPAIGKFQDKAFKSVTRGGAELDKSPPATRHPLSKGGLTFLEVATQIPI